MAADDRGEQRRSRHFPPITLFPGRALAGPAGTTILRVVYICPEKRCRRTNLLVEPEGLNPLRLCPVSYSVKFSGWKDLRMRPVRESGVPQRWIVARLAGLPVSRGGISRPGGTASATAISAAAIANRASVVGFPTNACIIGRKIIPLRVDLRRRSTPLPRQRLCVQNTRPAGGRTWCDKIPVVYAQFRPFKQAQSSI